MDDALRARFDRLMEEALESLPERLKSVVEEVPLVVDDLPDDRLVDDLMAEELGLEGISVAEFKATLCGLHSGVPLTDRSVNASADPPSELPTVVRLFREGIVNIAGGWEPQRDETQQDVEDAIYEEILVTVLHELGHHYGLEEDDLDALGYA